MDFYMMDSCIARDYCESYCYDMTGNVFDYNLSDLSE